MREYVRDNLQAWSDQYHFDLPGRLLRRIQVRGWLVQDLMENLSTPSREAGLLLHAPLIDHRLQEFVLSLPAEQLGRDGYSKVVVRHALRGKLPDEVIHKAEKTTPAELFNYGVRRASDKVWPLLTNMRLAEMGIVNEAILRRHFQEFLDCRHNDWRFWFALGAEDWLRRYFA